MRLSSKGYISALTAMEDQSVVLEIIPQKNVAELVDFL